MRTLERNKTVLWIVYPTGMVDEIDSDGFYTGEKIVGYSNPTKIKIMLYPSDGEIVSRIFGTDVSCDMIAISEHIDLNEQSLLFYNQPASNFQTTYDFEISKKLESLNTFSYGFEARV